MSTRKPSLRLQGLESRAPRGKPNTPPAAFLFDNISQSGLELAIIAAILESCWMEFFNPMPDITNVRKEAMSRADDIYAAVDNSIKYILHFDADWSLGRDRRHLRYHREHAIYLIEDSLTQIERAPAPPSSFRAAVDVIQQYYHKALMESALDELVNGYKIESQLQEPKIFSLIKTIDAEYLTFLAAHPSTLDRISWEAFERIVQEVFTQSGYDVIHVGTMWGKAADLLILHTNKNGEERSYIIECKRYVRSNKVGMQIVDGVLGSCRRNGYDAAFLVTTSTFSEDVEKARESLRHLQLELRDGDQLIEWLKWRYSHTYHRPDASRKSPAELWIFDHFDRTRVERDRL